VVRTEAALADVFGTEVVPVEPRRLGLVADVA
jgi:hypothetical protein